MMTDFGNMTVILLLSHVSLNRFGAAWRTRFSGFHQINLLSIRGHGYVPIGLRTGHRQSRREFANLPSSPIAILNEL